MDKLKSIREKKGLSLAQLENISGVSKGYLSDLENGNKKNPSLDTIKKISDALQVDLRELIGG